MRAALYNCVHACGCVGGRVMCMWEHDHICHNCSPVESSPMKDLQLDWRNGANWGPEFYFSCFTKCLLLSASLSCSLFQGHCFSLKQNSKLLKGKYAVIRLGFPLEYLNVSQLELGEEEKESGSHASCRFILEVRLLTSAFPST